MFLIYHGEEEETTAKGKYVLLCMSCNQRHLAQYWIEIWNPQVTHLIICKGYDNLNTQ